MTREVLVTGATGTLGRKLVGAATAAGHHVRAMSRRSHVGYTGVHWSQGDLLANTGIDAAVDGVDVVVHGATQGTGDKDVTSTQNLATAARRAGVGHIIYVSIVGIDRIPLPYYQTKLRVERALEASDVGHTVLRATQFHDLINKIFSIQRFSPVLWTLRGVRFQPIDTRDVAARLVELIDCEPAGRVADMGGPAVHTHAELARMYLAARGGRRPVVQMPVPGRIVAGYRAGANLAPDNPVGTIDFAEYLAEITKSLLIYLLRRDRQEHGLANGLACASVRRRLDIDEHSSVAERFDACCRHRSDSGGAVAHRCCCPGSASAERVRGPTDQGLRRADVRRTGPDQRRSSWRRHQSAERRALPP